MSDYRERHQELLAGALAVVADAALLAQLLAERDRLAAAAPRDVSDRAFELALVARLVSLRPPGGGGEILAELAAHPALVGLGRAPRLTAAGAATLVGVAASSAPRPGLADVPALRAASGDEAAFDELTGIVHAHWLATAAAERPYLERDVAVMLPVRLETLFKPLAGGWELWLRVIPDEASIRRDDPSPKAVEVRLLEAMWREIHEALDTAERAQPADEWLDTAAGRIAWEAFCGRVGGGRAAWLAAACPPVVDGVVSVEATGLGTDAPPNRVGGFPRRLEVWAAFGSDAPVLLDAFDVAVEALVFDVIGARPKGAATTELVHERDRWWISWPAAKDVGLGRVIPLPAGHAPADVRTLYVVGLGDEHPAEHFRAKIEAGEMATLPLGAPTNAVDGAQAAELGQDPAAWRRVARRRMIARRTSAVEESDISRSLGGVDAGLPAMPEARAIADLDRALVWALWPVLWGHQLRDLWGCVEDADQLASWARLYLRPEGPLSPIRLDDQPYGLLPSSILSRWSVADEEGAEARLEPRLRRVLLRMRSHWAVAARTEGNAVGADTRRLLDLIARDAVSAAYAYRTFFATELWAAAYAGVPGFSPQAFDDWVRATFRPVYDLVRREPDDPPGIRQLVAAGHYRPLTMPLVVPTRWPDAFYVHDGPTVRLDEAGNPLLRHPVERSFGELIETLMRHGHRYDTIFEQWRGVLPDSLLIRLLLHAGVLSAAAVVQASAPAPLREPVVGDTAFPTQLETLAQGYAPSLPHDTPAGFVRRLVVDGLERILKMIADQVPDVRALAQLERAFRATLDSAMHRIDPWITGFAARRLQYLGDRPETRFRLGVYGWVDGPILGVPGPTEAGLLHAPSHAQALTGAILRDKDVTERREAPPPPGDRALWSMQLESRRLRLAEEVAEEVRLGSHLFEVLGRRVEAIVGVRTPLGSVVEASARVDVVRATYPMKAGQPDRGRVCHGANALAGLLGAGPVPVAVTAPQRAELERLREVLDAYGDLLVAEAVHQVVTGHADRAGAAMDASAGLAKPPSFDFSETPLAGDATTVSVISVVPYLAAPSVPDAALSPARLADASVAAALQQWTGPASAWTWQATGPDGVPRTATLADLGLEPADTLVLAPDVLEDLARARLDVGDDVPFGRTARDRHLLARDIAGALGGQPAFLRDVASLTATPEEAEQYRDLDAAAREALRTRYGVVRGSVQLVIDELAAARAAADTARMRQAILRALRWGVTPLGPRDELRGVYVALVRGVVPAEPALLISHAERAETSLRERLAAAPPLTTTEPLARAIAELAAPDGRLAVLTPVSAATLVAASGLEVDAPDTGLEPNWLTVVAVVRPRLAAIEALQLEVLGGGGAVPSFAGFTAWSSAAGDPWQAAVLSTLRARRLQPGGNDPHLVLPRMVAAFTLGEPWPGDADGMVAVGLVDGWSEAIPRTVQPTTAAFGFNAPGARPPQAILLAVPPDLGTGYGVRLDTTALIAVLEETRELAHARAVDAVRLGGYLAAVPTATFGASGRTSVRLDPATTFPE